MADFAYIPRTLTAAGAARPCDLVSADATAGAFTVTLAPAASANGPIIVKKIDSTANAVTVIPAAGTIDGNASVVLRNFQAAVALVPSGANWVVIDSYPGLLLALSDNFTRADSAVTLGTPSTAGQPWTANSGTWGISSNQAYNPVAASPATATIDSGVADVTVQVTIPTFGSTPTAGLVLRYTDNNNFWRIVGDGTNTYLQRRIASVTTTPINVPGSAAGDTLKAVAVGPLIYVFRNGVQIGSVNDGFNATQTKHGLHNDSSGQTGGRWTNFTVTKP